MSEPESFAALMGRVRAGDELAAMELVRSYESAIRRVVRFRLTPRLRRLCDSMDICQAVLGNFFVHAALGHLELETPEQLMKLLATMARNELVKEDRRQRAARRDYRRQTTGSGILEGIHGGEASPSQEVAHRELIAEVRRRLTPEERDLAERRKQGQEWADIAAELGEEADALRKRLSRGIARVLQELGLEDEESE